MLFFSSSAVGGWTLQGKGGDRPLHALPSTATEWLPYFKVPYKIKVIKELAGTWCYRVLAAINGGSESINKSQYTSPMGGGQNALHFRSRSRAHIP